MLTEDEVANAVRGHLMSAGWVYVQSAMAVGKVRGEDLVMRRGDVRLSIEAKGETSSDPASKRYGKPFDSSQIASHVGRAVVKALAVVSDARSYAAIAFPATAQHKQWIDAIAAALVRLEVSVLWVAADGSVRADPDRLPTSEQSANS